MHRRGEAERGGIGRHVVHAAVGDQDGAGDAVRRHVGERRAERGEQPRAVGLAVGLAGLDDAHLEARDAAEPLGQRGARRFGLLRCGRRNSGSGSCRSTTTATEGSGSRSSRVNDGLASASRISASASARTSAPRLRREQQQQRDHDATAASATHST